MHRCAAAFPWLAAVTPDVLTIPRGMRIHPWPRLGTALVVEDGQPVRIDFHRDEFASAEAMTYDEYVLTASLRAERRAAEAAAAGRAWQQPTSAPPGHPRHHPRGGDARPCRCSRAHHIPVTDRRAALSETVIARRRSVW